MTGKERVKLALAHKEPDRVPIGEMGIDYPIIEQVLGRETYYRAQGKERRAIWEGRRDEVVRSQKEDLVALVQALDWDIVPVWLTYSDRVDYRPRRFLAEDKLKWQDADGNIWQAPDQTGDALCIDSHRITPAILDEMHRTPPAVDQSQLELVNYVVQELGETHFIIGRGWHAPSTWTDGSFPIPGEGLSIPIDTFLMMMYDDPDAVHAILAAYTRRAIEYGKILIAAGVDAVQINVDYCINTGPWLSPSQFETFILPYMQQQVDAFKQEGVYVLKHSDGNTWALIDMMVGTGIDALHGIQPSVGMDIKRLKEKIGDRVALFGAIEAETLINGMPEDVERAVEYCLKHGAPGGGFALTTSNSVQVGTKYENYMTMLRVAGEKGTYPISL
ncbi:MAG: uroporphyrinogen decarboxylase family protein [Chloroflexota bacterium]|nr:uroporphyrinogen decarboxylase family protein [Chloroflexota bacterium]